MPLTMRGDQLRNLGGLHAVIERNVEIPEKLDCLIARYERSQRDDTPVTLRQTRTIPDIAQQALLRVLAERWRDGLKGALHCAISPRPMLFITGDQAHSKEFSEDAYKRAAEPKELHYVRGAGHVDLYDRVNLIPWGKLESFSASTSRPNLAPTDACDEALNPQHTSGALYDRTRNGP